MIGASSAFSRLLLGCFILLLVYFLYMDVKLYYHIQNYPLRRNIDNTSQVDSSLFGSCDISPFCDVTVKSIMLDHPNHYLLSPMATLFDKIFRISQLEFITPNMISIFHILVAFMSAKCVASDSLVTRRIGVALFMLRSMLDDLDGHVARTRKNIHGEGSEIGSFGFYFDGLCDALGTVALLTGCFIFLKNNPPKKGYTQLQYLTPHVVDATKEFGAGVLYRGQLATTTTKVFQAFICLGVQLLLSSTAWNRYIALYQDLLENRAVSEARALLQIQAFRSSVMWTVSWLWRICNPQALINALLVAIFCDKVWEFLQAIQYLGFIVLVSISCISEMHVQEVQSFIYETYNNNTDV